MRLHYIAILCATSTASMLLAETLPLSRTITDNQGRSLEGTILSKTDETITVRRNFERKKFEIRIDTLSKNDQEFIANLSKKEQDGLKITQVHEPEKRVILAIPFEKQERTGLCAAASILNILKFHDPGLEINQVETLALFNSRRSGATPEQVALGINSLGYRGEYVRIQNENRQELTQRIKESLDQKRPLLIGNLNHATVLFGYDNTEKVFYAWDQRSSPQTTTVEGFPPGTSKFSEGSFLTRMVAVMFIHNMPKQLPPAIPTEIQSLNKTMDIRAYTILNANPSQESDIKFITRTAPHAIRHQLRRGNRVIFSTNLTDYHEVITITEREWEVRNVKTLEDTTLPINRPIYFYQSQFIVVSPK